MTLYNRSVSYKPSFGEKSRPRVAFDEESLIPELPLSRRAW